MNRRYSARFGSYFHQGMLWLRGVPGFKWVYIHVGNDDDDTDGCILTGYDARTDEDVGGGKVFRSTQAYKALYDWAVVRLNHEGDVWVQVHDGLPGLP